MGSRAESTHTVMELGQPKPASTRMPSRAAVRPEGRPLHFTTHGLTLAPFHLADDSRYGLTFLDVLWEQAPFATSARFVGAVRTLADTWLSGGLFTRAERDRVVAAAGSARLKR